MKMLGNANEPWRLRTGQDVVPEPIVERCALACPLGFELVELLSAPRFRFIAARALCRAQQQCAQAARAARGMRGAQVST